MTALREHSDVVAQCAEHGELLDSYAQRMVPVACLLVGAVRDAFPEEIATILADVRAAPAPAGTDPLAALAIVLAAMVDDSKTPRQLLAWRDHEPPARDLDEIAIERAMHGDAVPLTRAERREAVTRLTDRGYSANAIANRLRITQRAVVRNRSALIHASHLRDALPEADSTDNHRGAA